ncbi:unnamed protein product [Symbiodinium natans]|uniref:Uncharacterized protein n=1 Tax=Symbiodinium natans TaxID=878477 RepID=A0A812VFD4_9DINO|nr:unnamed protein product [Symbiodinium natans]
MLQAMHELDQKNILSSMEANAVRHKEQGNLAMENGEYRHAVKEYSHALSHAQDMMDYLEVEKSQPLNGYQLRALARGVPLPGRGPAALQPFRAVVLASRALAFLRLDAYDRAAQDAELACQLEPRYLKAWIRRAAALAAANLRQEAVEVLDEALQKACPTDLLREQVCKLVVNLRGLVNVEVKAPEKDLPVILKEADTAQKSYRNAAWQAYGYMHLPILQLLADVRMLATLELRRLLRRLDIDLTRTGNCTVMAVAADSSLLQEAAELRSIRSCFRSAKPALLKFLHRPQFSCRDRHQGLLAEALSRETRERLYPRSPAASRHAPMADEAFVSALVNLAIDFKGDAARASREGPRYLRRVHETDAEVDGLPGRWREGVNAIQDLDLLQFWLALPDKGRLGLLMKPERAQKAIQEYVAGKGAAERVSRAFVDKFGYETRDVNVLYRFWQSMPNRARAGQQVRGFADHEVLKLLQVFAQERAEDKAVPSKSPRDGRRGAWRPAGEHPEATQVLASPAITPRGSSKKRDIDILARSRPRLDALEFVRAIAKRFPDDHTLKHMLKQCLEGAPSSARAETDAYNLLTDTAVLKQASRDKAPKPAAGQLDARLKLQLPSQEKEGSFQKWLNQDADRAGRFLNLLQDASKISRKIRSYMRHRAKQCLERGARLGPTGPVVPARNRTEADLPALYVIEDAFAHLCRRFGANEVYVRFGPYYLCRTVNDSKEAKPLIEEVPDSTPGGGAVVECPTHSISCGPSTSIPDQKSGWFPNIDSPEFIFGGSWWQMDLGRLHSCAGVRLEWSVPSIKKVTYSTRAEFQSDLLLASSGQQIVVTQVRDGGKAFLSRVKPGDVLQLNAGGSADSAFVGLSLAEALTKLADDFLQPLTLVFKGAQLSGESQRLQRLLEKPLKVKVLVSKNHAAPTVDSPEQWEQVEEQDVSVTTQHPCIVPSIFVARWVRLRFESPWPKLDNEALALSVKVMKVWRLAPPFFRQQFLEVLRQVERQAAKGHALVRQPAPDRRFWASSVKSQSFNMVINTDIVRRVKHSHDSEGDEMLALQMMCMRDRKEFNILRSDEMLALRQRIFSKEEDVLECTFHPRTAANVPGHVLKFRERISERMDASKVTGIKDFVKELGDEFKAHKYPNYWKVHRRAMLQKAKRDFVRGALKSSMEKLQRHFGVQQMLDRFRCYHKNCGRKLDHHAEICKCAGFYCHIHKPPQVHNCKDMKKILETKAKEAKDLEIKLREEGEAPPPEEKFDNKVEIGLLLEAHELAESIQAAMKEKDRQKHNLERLGQSLASFGAVRLMERPFKRRMCPEAIEKRRARSAEALEVLPRWMGGSKFNAEGTPRTPRLGCRSASRERCKCPNAHSPSELRFPAGESVQRRMDWVKKAVRRADMKSEAVPNSAAERELELKRKKEEEKVPPPPAQTGRHVV